jgi:ATP-dependent RNA circularization protein (DNA/RNA ligase family)
MSEYHKIQSVYKRDGRGNMLFGEFSTPELELLADAQWVFTEKIDGTNIRVMFDGDAVKFGGRTDEAQIYTGILRALEGVFCGNGLLRLKEAFPSGAVLYGEGYGAKVQKGGGNYKADGQGFCLFDVKVGDYYLDRAAVQQIAEKFGVQYAAVLGEGSLRDMVNRVEGGLVSAFGPFEAEGIVARPAVDLFDRKGNRIIAKIKAKDFKKAKVAA